MPTATEAVRETRTMRLLSRALGDAGPLSTFLARQRCPGANWVTWETLSFRLHALTGEHITREGLHKMAIRYGIPDTSRTDDPDVYRMWLADRGITI